MGIDNDKLSLFLKDLLQSRLAKNHDLVKLPAALLQPLAITSQPKGENPEIEEILITLNPKQIEQINTEAPAAQNTIIINPEAILVEARETSLTNESKSENDKKSIVEEEPKEKPQLSLNQLINNTLAPIMPLPVGIMMNVISTASEGNNSEEARKQKSETKGEGDKTSTEDSSDNTTKTSLWDSFSKIFEPITKPFTQLWDGVKKQIGIEKLSDLFSKPFQERITNFIEQFNKNDNSKKQLEKKLTEQQLDKETQTQKQITKADETHREFQEEIERQQREREAQAKADAERAYAERLAQETRAKQAAAELAEKQREEQAKAIELAAAAKTSSVNELPRSLKNMINIANTFGLSIDMNSLASNASLDDVKRKINMKILDDPKAGIAYLASIGKDLNPILDKMITSTNSANISKVVLNRYLNSGSETPTLKKTINEYLQQQGRSNIIQA